MNRRHALQCLTAAATAVGLPAAASGAAADPAQKTGLGIVLYSLGLRRRAEKQANANVDLFEPLTMLEHCRRLGAGGIQTPLGIRDAAYTDTLRQRAQQHGMFLETTLEPPWDKSHLDRFDAELRTASAAGVRAARTVLMPGRRYEFFDTLEKYREYDRRARQALELAAPIAQKHQVRLAVENHKDHRTAERVALLKHIDSPWVGACVDTGNNFALLEDPLDTAAGLAPWALAVHLKDGAVREYADGFLLADVPLGQGCFAVRQIVNLLRRARPELRFCLELITRDPLKVPCLTDKYWVTLADVPGRDLARTLRTVRQRQATALPQVSTLPPAAQLALEDANLAASLKFAREQLEL